MSTQGSFYAKATTAHMYDDTTSGHGGFFSDDQTASHHI